MWLAVGSMVPLDLSTLVAEIRSIEVVINAIPASGRGDPATILRVFRFIREFKMYPLAQVSAIGGESASFSDHEQRVRLWDQST